MASRIGITAYVGLDGRGFRAGLVSLERSAMMFAKRIAGYFAVTAILYKLTQLARETFTWAAGLQETAESIGMSFEEIQKLDYIAEQTGTSLEKIVTAIRRISTFRLEALADPTGKSARLAESLGISRKEMEGMSDNWKLFARFANVIRDNDFGASQLAIVNELFGRGATELIPAMRQGINSMAGDAANLGLVLKNDVGKELDRLDDTLKEIQKTMKVIAAPPLAGMARGLQALMAPFKSKQTGQHIVGELFTKPLGGIITGAIRGAVAVAEEAAGRGVKPIDEIIKAMGKTKTTTAVKDLAFKPSTDELARIGGFIGGTGTSQVNILKNIERNTDKAAKAGEQTARKLENL